MYPSRSGKSVICIRTVTVFCLGESEGRLSPRISYSLKDVCKRIFLHLFT